MKIIVEDNVLVGVEIDGKIDADITEFAVPEGVAEIAYEALGSLPLGVEKLYIPQSVKKIDPQAFFGEACNWEKLKEIVVAEGNQRYKSQTGCLIDMQSNTVMLGTENATIPDGIQKIGLYAFRERQNLTEIVIPASVKCLDVQAIACCHNLKKVTVWGKDTNLDNLCFVSDTAITEFVLPQESNYQFVDGCLIKKSDNSLLLLTDGGTIPSSVKRAALASVVRYFNDVEIPQTIQQIDGCVIVLGGAKLRVKKDSVAHKYAVENNLPYQEI